VVEVARQTGNAPSVSLDVYGHVFEERDSGQTVTPAEAINAARSEFDVREEYAEAGEAEGDGSREPTSDQEALLRTRTADPSLPCSGGRNWWQSLATVRK